MITKIISGGQTGADRAALDVAMIFWIDHGGYVPKGRLADDGILDQKYNMTELDSDLYYDRTKMNVASSDGTLILSHGSNLTGGTKLTLDLCKQTYFKPFLHIDLLTIPLNEAIDKLYNWIIQNNISVLNCAGPRSAKDPYIYTGTYNLLLKFFDKYNSIMIENALKTASFDNIDMEKIFGKDSC